MLEPTLRRRRKTMRKLPKGTVTFVFTDIEGSTRLLHELGDSYAGALADHRRCLRGVFAAHDGVEVDTQGDAFFYAFTSARRAVAAASEAQRALAAGRVRVRIGLHTGEPLLTEDGYVGIDVHRAARIAACGHGGQVLLSEQTRSLLGEGVDARDLGLHRLKDLLDAEHIFQIGDADFPPLKSLHQTNLPVQPTPFIGRERELGDVLTVIRRKGVRLLTLTGPGGAGKTRLALQAAVELDSAYPDGVWFVSLAGLTDSRLVIATIARSLGLRETGSDTWDRILLRYLSDKHLLLVIDNIEHLLPDAAGAVGELLAAAPEVRALVTSREPLKLAAEHEFPVAPLAAGEATSLFAERARAVLPSFGLSGENRPAVEAICARLDCLPLAIELAVPWMRTLPLAQLLDRLEQRLPLLTGGTRDAPERQRTLRAAIAWSFGLLPPAEQQGFYRLSVFAGGFSLDAAEAACAADLPTVAALVEKNLVRREPTPDGETRYVMLETIREFAVERLAESHEARAVSDAHAAYFRAVSDHAAIKDKRVNQAGWLRRLDIERDNLRAAFEWLVRREPHSALRLTLALKIYWARSEGGEGRTWLDRALAASTEPDELRAEGLFVASLWAIFHGRLREARQRADEALQLGQELGSAVCEGNALHALALIANREGPEDWSEAGLSLFRDAESVVRRSGDNWSIALLLNNFGYTLYDAGDYEGARRRLTEGLALADELGDEWQRSAMYGSLADVELATGNTSAAEASFRRELELARDIGGYLRATEALTGLARLAFDDGRLTRCLQLLGAASELFHRTGSVLNSPDPVLIKEAQEKALGLIGGERADAAWQQGTRMTLEQAVQFGLASVS
jgi:predicted ATPase/class 3 adenylate cyclase/Tfp pilus assembly protein PilF